MKPLEVYRRNQVMFVRMRIHDKSMGMKDYLHYNENGFTYFVFRKSHGVYELAYVELADDIKEAFIDALIIRFDNDVPEIFYHQGKRQVIEVRVKKFSLWHIYLNEAIVGSITCDKTTGIFQYHIDDQSLLTDDHAQKYIAMIQRGEIKWRKEDIQWLSLSFT